MTLKFFKFSLRTKLMIIISALLAFAVGSICYYLINIQRQNYIDREIAFQESMSGLLSDLVSSQYFNYINQQVVAILNERTEIKNKTDIIEYYNDFINHNTPEKYENLLNNQAKRVSNFDLHLFVYDHKKNSFFYNKDDEALLHAAGTSQSMRTIYNTLKNKNQTSGYFLALKNDQKYYIAYILYDTKNDRSYALVKDIGELTLKYANDNQVLRTSINESLSFISSHWDGNIIIFEKDKEILSTVKEQDKNFKIPSYYLIRSQAKNFKTELIGTDRQYFIKVSFFRPLNWYLVSLRDADAVFAPIHNLTKFVITIGIITVVIALFLSFLLTRRVTLSLSKLSQKANLLAKADLSDPKATEKLFDDFKTNDSGEIGNLEKAIVHMGKSINDNVNTLITINSKQSRIEGELNAARDIQKGLLPSEESLPTSDKVTFASCLYPAKEVAGDFYDIFRVDPTHIAFVIGDVSDKGVPAALFMSTTITMMRQALSLGKSPSAAVTSVNNRLAERNPNMMFVTMIALVLDENTGTCTICNAGHCLPIIVDKEEIKELDELSGAAAGVMEDLQYTEFTCKLGKNQSLILYTDGISEAQNEKGEFFGVDDIKQTLSKTYTLSAQEILHLLNSKVSEFRGNALQSDDITALCITVKDI